MMELWIFILNNLLAPRLAGATESNLQYTIVSSKLHSAVQIIVVGFSQNLHVIVEEIVQNFGKMESLATKNLFEDGIRIFKAGITDALRDPSVLKRYVFIIFYV